MAGGKCWLGIVASAMCLIEGGFHYYKSHHIKKTHLSRTNLKETLVNLIETKSQITKFTLIDLFVATPIFFFFVGYVVWTVHMVNLYILIPIMCVGYIIGIDIEWYIISRQRQYINKMIDTLQEGAEV